VVTAREEGLAARCLASFGIARARRKHCRFSMRCSCPGAPSVVVWLSQKELRPRQASPKDRCRSQREGQMAEYRAINECWSLSRKEQKRLAASNALSIQSRVERERSTKRLTGDCPDDHFLFSRYPPVPCFPTLLPRQVD
jgi:hypothetical protein